MRNIIGNFIGRLGSLINLPTFDDGSGIGTLLLQWLFSPTKTTEVKSDGYTYVQDAANKGTVRDPRDGSALDFDGIDGVVTIPHSSSLTFGNGTIDQPFSITAWVNMDDWTNAHVISTGDYFFGTVGSDQLSLTLWDGSIVNRIALETPALTAYEGDTLFVVATYNGSGLDSGQEVYVYSEGGVLLETTAGGGNNNAGTYVAMDGIVSDIFVGRYLSNYSDGRIWDVRVHNTELTTAEIEALVDNPQSLTGHEVGIWHLDEEEGLTAFDSSGNGNHGTHSGGVTHVTQNTVTFPNVVGYSEGLYFAITGRDASLPTSEPFLQEAGDYFEIAFIKDNPSLQSGYYGIGVDSNRIATGFIYYEVNNTFYLYDNYSVDSFVFLRGATDCNKVRLLRTSDGVDVTVYYNDGYYQTESLSFTSTTAVFDMIDDCDGIYIDGTLAYIDNNGTIYNDANDWNGITWENGNTPETTTVKIPKILGSYSESLLYLPIPASPEFSAFTTISPTDTDITTADLAGNTDLVLASGTHTPRVRLFELVGTETNPIRIKGEGITSTIVGNDVELTNSILYGNGADWVEIYDLKVRGGGGFVWELSSGNILLQNLHIQGDSTNGFSGFRSKTDNDDTVTPYKIQLYYLFIEDVIGEGVYIGQVNGATYHNISVADINHIRAVDCGREPCQFSHIEDLTVNHFTGIRAGQTNESSQNRAFQVQDCNGIIKNSMFSSVGVLGDAYMNLHNSDGITFKNCYFEAEEPFYIGNNSAKDWYATSTIKGNKDIILDGCILKRLAGGTITDLMTVYFDECNIIVKNCLISNNITDLFNDQRGDKVTYSLIDGGGNEFVALTHESMTPTFDSQDRVSSDYHIKRGMGWLMSDPVEPSYSSVTISGTETTGETLTASVSGADAGGGTYIGNTTYQWFRSDDISGTNRTAISGAVSSTYTIQRADDGKYLDVEAYPANNLKISGTSTSAKTGAIVAASWSPFLDITWDSAFDMANATDIATAEAVTNQGAYGDAVKTAFALPTYDGTYGGLVFVSATQQQLTLPYGSVSTDFEVWWSGRLDALTTNHKAFGFGSSHMFRIKNTGEIVWGAVDTGVILSADTDYVIRFYINGASSTITVNNGTPQTFTASTGTNNVTGRIGSEHDDTDFFDGKQKFLSVKETGLSAGEITNMWTWFGL